MGINLTLIVEIIIFAIFFLIIDRLIWQPFLKNIAEREKSFSNKEKEIEEIANKARELNELYTTTLRQKELNAQREIDAVTKLAYANQREMIEEKQRESRIKLAEYKEFLKSVYCTKKEDFDPYIDSLVEEMHNVITQRRRIL